MRLHEEKTTVYRGEIIFHDRDGKDYDILKLPEKEMDTIRGNKISIIFQDPMTSLNPVIKVGTQVTEVIMHYQKLPKKEAVQKTLELFSAVGIRAPELRYNQFPHEFSGGMQQRIMIAIALACNPVILLADEPTTALDVTIQAQILHKMKEIQANTGMSIVFITHDLGVVAHMCEEIAVMYAGQVVEYADTESLFANPKHPYTQGLLSTIPRIGEKKGKLNTIEGMPPKLDHVIEGCPFAERCRKKLPCCETTAPSKYVDEKDNMVRCHLYAPEGAEKQQAVSEQCGK